MRFGFFMAAVIVATPAFAQSDSTGGGTGSIQLGGAGGQGIQIIMNGQSMNLGQMTLGGGAATPSSTNASVALKTSASLGLSLAMTGTKRDTIGIFVERVAPGGPAEAAGIREGDRIVAIDSFDLGVASNSLGDASLKEMQTFSLRKKMERIKPGTVAHLRIYSGGQFRTLAVKAKTWSDVYANDGALHDTNTAFAIF